MLITEFVARYPLVYHMAERGTWPSIESRGLMSTTAVLDLYGVRGERRVQLERRHRSEKVTLTHARFGAIVLRDQKPMPVSRLRMCLPSTVSASAWYRHINRRVFFWVEEHRLRRLLKARPYRTLDHDVLIVRTEQLLARYETAATVARMNSGNTFPAPAKRDMRLFQPIADYPTTRTGRPKPDIVELTVDYAVPDIRRFVVDVRHMRADLDFGSIR